MYICTCIWASHIALEVKNSLANAGDIREISSIPGSGRSPGVGHVTYSGILSLRIPWTEESSGLLSKYTYRCIYIYIFIYMRLDVDLFPFALYLML